MGESLQRGMAPEPPDAARPPQDEEVLAALDHDDAWAVVRVLSRKPACVTELVRPANGGADAPFYVRKRIPSELANVDAWQAARSCDHPLLPRVRDLYRLPDQFVAVCDYVPGISVADLVEHGGPIEVGRACRIARDVCSAAGALHGKGVVHRDISPSNVIVADDGAHLVDLGIARVSTVAASRDTTTLGTPNFAAPEQFGFVQTDARADVYSIGRLLAFMLIGELPGPSAPDEGLAAVDEEAPALAAVIRKACSFDRGERYQTASDLAAAIRAAEPVGRVASRVPPSSAPSPTPEPPAPKDPEKPTRAPRHTAPAAPMPLAAAREAWRTPVAGIGAREIRAGLRAASLPRKVIAVPLMVFAAAIAVIFVLSNLDGAMPPLDRERFGTFLMSCSLAAITVIWFLGEIPAALTRVGPYRSLRVSSIVVMLVVRVLRQGVIWFVVAMVISAFFLARY